MFMFSSAAKNQRRLESRPNAEASSTRESRPTPPVYEALARRDSDATLPSYGAISQSPNAAANTAGASWPAPQAPAGRKLEVIDTKPLAVPELDDAFFDTFHRLAVINANKPEFDHALRRILNWSAAKGDCQTLLYTIRGAIDNAEKAEIVLDDTTKGKMLGAAVKAVHEHIDSVDASLYDQRWQKDFLKNINILTFYLPNTRPTLRAAMTQKIRFLAEDAAAKGRPEKIESLRKIDLDQLFNHPIEVPYFENLATLA
jgi:hypothetical protein